MCLAIMTVVAQPSRTAEAAVTKFYWGGSITGGYSSNVFFSDERKVSSTGGSVALSFGAAARTQRNVFDLSYAANYYQYADNEASGSDNLSHTLGARLDSQWSTRTRFSFSELALSTPEQNTFVLRPENPFSVTQRARRTRFETRMDWNIDLTERFALLLDYSNAISQFDETALREEDPLRDELMHRAGVGFSKTATERSRVGVNYQYTKQEFDEVGGSFEDSENEAHGISGEYSWEISEESLGRVSAGLVRSEGEQTSTSRRSATTTWTLGAAINRRLSERVSTYFGASRNVSSFEGFGGSAIGETAFATFNFDTSERSNISTTANWTNRREFQEASQSIRTLGVQAEYRQRVARWGGYNLNYFFIDQGVSGAVAENRRDTRYDVIRAGLFFQKPGANVSRRSPL